MNAFLLLLSACFVLYHGVSGFDADVVSVFVMEGDSVTLNSYSLTASQQEIVWYCYTARLAQIIADQTKICTDHECKKRFGDRLKVDQTGSLTITNTRTTDSGLYKKFNIASGTSNEKTFNVTVHAVSAAKRVEPKRESVKERESVIEGESVTLDSGGIKNPNESLQWYFDETLIAEITGNQSQICTDDECKERFRDRLKVDHQTGSLTIMNSTNADSGEYLLIFSVGRSRVKSFSVDVTAAGPSSAAVVGCVSITVLILLVALGVMCYCKRTSNGQETDENNHGLPKNTDGASVSDSALQNTAYESINLINISPHCTSENQSDEANNVTNVSASCSLENELDEETIGSTHCQLENDSDKLIAGSTVHQSENDGNKETGGNRSENDGKKVTGENQSFYFACPPIDQNDKNKENGGKRSENGNFTNISPHYLLENQSEEANNVTNVSAVYMLENELHEETTASTPCQLENGLDKKIAGSADRQSGNGENRSENGRRKVTGGSNAANEATGGDRPENIRKNVIGGKQSKNDGEKVTGENNTGNKATGGNRSGNDGNKTTGGNRLQNDKNKETGGNDSKKDGNKVIGGNQSKNIVNKATGGIRNIGNTKAAAGNRSESIGNKKTVGNQPENIRNEVTGGNRPENDRNKDIGGNRNTGNYATGEFKSENKENGGDRPGNIENEVTCKNQLEIGADKSTGGNQSANAGNKATGGKNCAIQ